MRVVLDTNTLVSGVISPGGPPRRLLDGARVQTFEMCSSATLLAELLDVLACAIAGRADLIVSGDKHLHGLGGQYRGIPIVSAAQAVARVGA